jgi:transcriptional regulator with XRE-family HTH domain
MKGLKPYLRENKDYESPLGEYRTAMGLSTLELAEKIGTGLSTIAALQNGTMPPYYEKRRGKHKVGEIRPYVKKMCTLFNVELKDLFPRYICDIQRYNPENIRDCYTDEQLMEFHTTNLNQEEIQIKKELSDFVHEVMKKTKERIASKHFDIMQKRYFQDYSTNELAKEYSLTKSRIHQIYNETLKTFKFQFEIELKKQNLEKSYFNY